jgi:hypothetical protein
VPAGALLACIVQQSLRDLLPDDVATVEPDSVDGLDLHGALAPATRDAQHVTLDFRKPSPPHLGAIGLDASLGVPNPNIRREGAHPEIVVERAIKLVNRSTICVVSAV